MSLRERVLEAQVQATTELGILNRRQLEQDETLLESRPDYKVRHVMPGRIRLCFPLFSSCGDLTRGMERHLSSEPGVTRVRGNTLCGSVVIEFDPEAVQAKVLLKSVDALTLRDLLQRKNNLVPMPARPYGPLKNQNSWIIGGHIFLGLGILGYALPILPGTPLLLLSGACYLRGSERLFSWLINHPVLGPPVRDYYEGKGIPARAKVYAITFLWLSSAVSIAMFSGNPYIVGMLLLMATATTLYLLSLKTADDPHGEPA